MLFKEKVYGQQTDRHTTDEDYHNSSPGAFGSGRLNKNGDEFL